MKVMILFVAEYLEPEMFKTAYNELRKAAYDCEEPCTVLLIDGVGENKLQIEEI